MEPPIFNNSSDPSTPMFGEGKDILSLVKAQEKSIKDKIPSVLQKDLPKPSKDFQDYLATGSQFLKDKVASGLKILQDTEAKVAEKVPEPLLAYGGNFVKNLNENFGAGMSKEKKIDAALSFTPMGMAENVGNKIVKQGVKIFDQAVESKAPTIFEGFKDLTTKILKDLEGKTTVSKQYILDATNRGELKQVERDLTRQILDTMPSKEVNVQEFANKLKQELLPLVRKDAGFRPDINTGAPTEHYAYESITLPPELRGNVKNYSENIYESPINTSAGSVHFRNTSDKYFGHTRIEDMADNKTRRVIEVQSDLYQKGNLEDKVMQMPDNSKVITENLPIEKANRYKELQKLWKEDDITKQQLVERSDLYTEAKRNFTRKSAGNLTQYNDPTAHFRMIREEIKKAAQDGKTKLQFPTGETAMKVEGLSQGTQGDFPDWLLDTPQGLDDLRNYVHEMKVGNTIVDRSDNTWVITDVLGDGKFKAVQKQQLFDAERKPLFEGNIQEQVKKVHESYKETFDISGKVDQNNPIYKFYEKDVGKYLNKFGAKQIVDKQGVSWYEVPIKKEDAKLPVEAFGALPLLFGKKEQKPTTYKVRDQILTDADLEEAKAILFGEVSNRSIQKQKMEANLILNTAINRMREFAARGTPKTLTEVLQMDKQYQAFKGKEYEKYKSGKTGVLDKQKIEAVNKQVERIKNGTFKDNTSGEMFYHHVKGKKLILEKKPLFK